MNHQTSSFMQNTGIVNIKQNCPALKQRKNLNSNYPRLLIKGKYTLKKPIQEKTWVSSLCLSDVDFPPSFSRGPNSHSLKGKFYGDASLRKKQKGGSKYLDIGQRKKNPLCPLLQIFLRALAISGELKSFQLPKNN